jgi:hypothetical protein
LRHALPLLAALALCACSPGGKTDAAKPGEDPRFAGLDGEIVKWRADIEKTNPTCTAAGGCLDYEIACKGERPLSAEDQAKGVTARVVAAITFNPKVETAKPGSAFAEFARSGAGWTRTEAQPVNLSSCASF